jgi:type IV pilus assembly protein PilQ
MKLFGKSDIAMRMLVMRKLGLLTMAGIWMLVGACAHLPEDPLKPQTPEEIEAIAKANEQREFRAVIRRRLDVAHRQLDRGELDAAEASIQPLLKLDLFKDEVSYLQASIELARSQKPLEAQQKVGQGAMLQEVQQAGILPASYGSTVVIDSNLKPIELPPGPMEELVNRKVTINLTDAGVAELVQALNAEGLNVIADDALQEEKTLTISVNEVPLKELFGYIARNMGIAFNLGENLIWVTRSLEVSEGPQLETRIIRLPQGALPVVPQGGPSAPGATMGSSGNIPGEEDNDLEEALTALLASSPVGASFRIFRTRNILVVRDSRENLRLVEELVREFDKPPYQVAIEARFISISQNDLRDLGVEIAQKNFVPNLDPLAPEGVRVTNMLTELGALGPGAETGVGLMNVSGVIANRTFDVLVSAIENKASSVTLSAPRVTVMNNRTARFRMGDNIYYFEEYDVVTFGGSLDRENRALAPTGTPVELPLGITFDVRVNIGNDGRTVLLGLKPEIVEFVKWEDYTTFSDGGEGAAGGGGRESAGFSLLKTIAEKLGIDTEDLNEEETKDSGITQVKLPRTNEKMIATTVGVSSGQTVVLGGMMERLKTKKVSKVPVLGDIPLLGVLFRHTSFVDVPSNLLIFVTANVINDRGEYVEVTPTIAP